MKKLILLLSLLFTSCFEEKEYKLKYVVFYPNSSDTITIINDCRIYWQSTKGTNTIWSKNKTHYENTAPFKILEYSQIK